MALFEMARRDRRRLSDAISVTTLAATLCDMNRREYLRALRAEDEEAVKAFHLAGDTVGIDPDDLADLLKALFEALLPFLLMLF